MSLKIFITSSIAPILLELASASQKAYGPKWDAFSFSESCSIVARAVSKTDKAVKRVLTLRRYMEFLDLNRDPKQTSRIHPDFGLHIASPHRFVARNKDLVQRQIDIHLMDSTATWWKEQRKIWTKLIFSRFTSVNVQYHGTTGL
jgi:hypothetical protein